MKVNGYDNSQPIIIWKEANLLIDGHTRCKSAEKAGLYKVAVVYMSFPDIDAALKYAYGLQFKRRNLDDSDRYNFAEQYLNNVVQGNKKNGWKKQELSEILSVSLGTAQKYISIITRGSTRIKENVKTGNTSINSAYNTMLKNKKPGISNSTITSKTKPTQQKSDSNHEVISIDFVMLQVVLSEWKEKSESQIVQKHPYNDCINSICELLPEGNELKSYAQFAVNEEDNDVSI